METGALSFAPPLTLRRRGLLAGSLAALPVAALTACGGGSKSVNSDERSGAAVPNPYGDPLSGERAFTITANQPAAVAQAFLRSDTPTGLSTDAAKFNVTAKQQLLQGLQAGTIQIASPLGTQVAQAVQAEMTPLAATK